MDRGRREEEIEDMSLSPPSMGSMQIAGSNIGFAHNIEFMSQAYLRNRYSEIDIENVSSFASKDLPLPIFLKVLIVFIYSLYIYVIVVYNMYMMWLGDGGNLCSLKMWSIR